MKNKEKNIFAHKVVPRKLRKVILVITEGAVTERRYIDIVVDLLKDESLKQAKEKSGVKVVVIKHGDKSSPNYLLRCLCEEIGETLDDNYSAWLICDRDQWTREQFDKVLKWVNKDPQKNHWILSAPNFEYWLSLHFNSSDDWRQYLKNYDKRIRPSDFSLRQIVTASQEARRQFQNNSDLFEHNGSEMFEFIEYLASEYGLDIEKLSETIQ